MALTKISGGVIQPDNFNVGVITATSLNAAGVVTASTVQVGSATTIHTSGIDLGSGSITSHNINSTGIITASRYIGNADITGGSIVATAATFTGNVSIGGTLTYEDVANIDSVGVITARTDVHVGAGLSVVGVSTFANGLIVTGGSVGIGTDNPATTLHLKTSDPRITITDSDAGGDFVIRNTSGAGYLTLLGSHPMLFYTNSEEKLRINANGNIGIGTNNPTTKLVVQGDWVNSTGQLRIKPSSAGQTLSGFTFGTQDNTLLATNYSNSSTGNLYFQNNTESGNIIFTGPTLEHFRINSSGQVGINTTAPQTTLDVWGIVSITNENAGIQFSDPDDKAEYHQLYMKSGDNSLNFKTYNGTDGWVDRVKLNTNGSIGINTSSVDDAAQVQIRGSSDGVLNLDTTDGRGSFIRFKENGTTKAWVGCSEGLGTGGDQDDLGLRAVDNIFFQTGTSNKVSINSSGTLNVSNIDTGNDSALNVLKSSGDDADKAILRVGFDASNCFEIYRIRNNADIFLNTTQSSAETRIQFLSKDVATISDRGALAVGKLAPKVVKYQIANYDTDFSDEKPTRFYLYYSAGSSAATHHFARMISQTDWGFNKWTVKQIKMSYSPTNSDLATWDNNGYYGTHNFYVSNYNQGGSTTGGGNYNYIGINQNLGPGGTFQIHTAANGGYYRDCWATDYYVSLPAYNHVLLEITVYDFGYNAWDSSTSVTDVYPALFGGSATQAQADSWSAGRGIWFDAAPGSFKWRTGTTTGVMWDT